MRLLLDTHIVLWFIDGSSRLPDSARKLIDDVDNDVYVSDISTWEVAIKHQKRPDKLAHSASYFMDKCSFEGFRRAPISIEAILEYERLDTSNADCKHRDPFDRMLIAQSKAENMLLVTCDKSFELYGEPLVTVF